MSRITDELREAMHYTNGYSFAVDFVFEECCDRIDASFDQHQAENAKLREQIDAAHMFRLLTENENESLQELIEDMLNCIDIQIAFERVPARWMRDEFAGRAHELGIEVD